MRLAPMTQPVFLTGRFRSGSTLLWNLFRQLDATEAYYEPLHPKLLHYLRLPPPAQGRHFNVESYFDEYKRLGEIGRYHAIDFGVSRLHLEAQDDHPRLEGYLRYLLDATAHDRIPVLKFNRIDFRLPWIRRVFPNAHVVHLNRSARNEWVSLLAAAGEGGDPALEADPFQITTWGRDLCAAFPFLASHHVRHLYQRHYYLWKLSTVAGSRLATFSLRYEDLLEDGGATIERLLAHVSLLHGDATSRCLRIVVRGPQEQWRSYRDRGWFEDLEGECDAQLDALGLTAEFGIRPLGEIAAQNPRYQAMLLDARARAWPLESSHVALSKAEISCDEKEHVIHGVSTALEQSAQQVRRLSQEVQGTTTALGEYAWVAETRLRARSVRERIRRFVAPRLGVLYQYPPRPVQLPLKYGTRRLSTGLPSLSVVTPSLNQGGFVERTIRSVLEQAYPGIQYFVQDGGSSDETPLILNRYDALLHYESAPDDGQASAINRGFARTSGEIMAYLNSDDTFLPGALQFVGRYFARHPAVDVVYGHRVVIDEHDQEVGRWILPAHDDHVLTFADYVPQETLFWRRRLWDKVGRRIDETFQFAMDWDLLLRFRDVGARFARLPRFLGAFRVHPHQKTSAKMASLGVEEMGRLVERCHGRRLGPAEIHKSVRPYLMRHLVLHKLYRCGILRY